MAEQTHHTAHDDAPLSAAKHPDASAAESMEGRSGDVLIARTVCIDRPKEELYAFWRNFGNLQRFMENVVSVKVLDDSRSHWVIAAPGDRTVEWDSRITEDIPGERIAWAAVEGASVRNSGMVQFRRSSSGRGTFVTVTIAYDPPGGTLGRLVAKLYRREPDIQARQDLRRFKQLMETGEIPTAAPPDAAPRA